MEKGKGKGKEEGKEKETGKGKGRWKEDSLRNVGRMHGHKGDFILCPMLCNKLVEIKVFLYIKNEIARCLFAWHNIETIVGYAKNGS